MIKIVSSSPFVKKSQKSKKKKKYIDKSNKENYDKSIKCKRLHLFFAEQCKRLHKGENMTVTIKDIAKKVGVNPSTVSRVINGTASISNETKEKIYATMKEMDYYPNSLARSLVNGSTFTIGLVMDAGNRDAFSNAFFIQSVSAIETVSQDRGYNLLITSDKNLENENAVKHLVLEHKVDGVILPISSMTKKLVEFFLNNETPFVIMGEPEEKQPEVCWVDMDNEQGGSLAVTHLLDSGYKHPVLLVESQEEMFEKKRILGFQRELERRKMFENREDIVECGKQGKQVSAWVSKLLRGEVSGDSIICTNNIVAYHVLQELKKGGKKIPEDIGVMTFDNYPLAEYMEPALTVVDVNTYMLGEEAAIVLFDKIKQVEKKEKNILIPTKIMKRKSTQKGG